ncbi:ATP-binding cassette domain-containing protein [Nitriliruptoria bacterium AS10]|nr:ATP-binding cassette domain-containing protein [Salsipaludibacter albus]
MLDDVGVVRGGVDLLAGIDLQVHARRPLAVLGPNGAGKTTLLRILSTYLFPTRGRVEVLGAVFGRTDLRALRARVALVSVAMTPLLPASHAAVELVAAARHGALRPVPAIDDEDRERARTALGAVGAGGLADRAVRTLSQGEWQRVQVARALVAEPELLLLDEPFAGLDLGGRERLVADLDRLLASADAPAVVMVSHHLEELPTAVADAVLLRGGRVVAAGAVDDAVTDETVSATFGVPVVVSRHDGRLAARVRSA